MKLLVLLFAVVTFAAHHPSDYLKFLMEIEKSHEFMAFTTEEQALFRSLVSAAQTGPNELNALIKKTTFAELLNITDKLDEDDIPHWEEFLAYYLDPTVFQDQGHGHHKRQLAPMDLFEWMRELHLIHKIEDDLHKEDRATFMALMYALEHDTLTTYIDQVGYAKVLKLLSDIDEDYEHDIDHMLMTHLEKEAAKGVGQVQSTTMNMPDSTTVTTPVTATI